MLAVEVRAPGYSRTCDPALSRARNTSTIPSTCSTGSARTLADLPTAARRYLDRIQELAATPIRYVSVGTRRDQIIEV